MSAPVALETVALLGLRASFYLLARRYLQRTLFSDLRQVIHEETSASSPTSLTSNGGHESPDEYPLSPSNGHSSLRDQLYNLRGAASSSSSVLPTTTTARGGLVTPTRSRASSGSHGSKAQTAAGKGVAPKIAGAVFCLSVSECSTLFALILSGGAVSLKYIILPYTRVC